MSALLEQRAAAAVQIQRVHRGSKVRSSSQQGRDAAAQKRGTPDAAEVQEAAAARDHAQSRSARGGCVGLCRRLCLCLVSLVVAASLLAPLGLVMSAAVAGRPVGPAAASLEFVQGHQSHAQLPSPHPPPTPITVRWVIS